MNDKVDNGINLGDFINHISNDFRVECDLKESVKFNNSRVDNIIFIQIPDNISKFKSSFNIKFLAPLAINNKISI